MNIIEAIQAAENGKLITNNFLKIAGHFLKYEGAGVFSEYHLTNDKPEYLYDVRHFSTAHVLSNAWEVLETNPFK
jgi:hypothetical protein